MKDVVRQRCSFSEATEDSSFTVEFIFYLNDIVQNLISINFSKRLDFSCSQLKGVHILAAHYRKEEQSECKVHSNLSSLIFCMSDANVLHMELLYVNPYPADLFFPLLRYMPNSTKVMLIHFIHALPSVTKVQGTKVLQKFLVFAHIFNIVNLLWIG